MKSIHNPIIKSDSKFNDTITHGTLTIYIDPSYRPEFNKRQWGFMESDFGKVKAGEKVYFHYLSLDPEPQLPPDKWVVPKQMLYCYIRDGKIHTLNDYLFVEIIKEEQIIASSIIIPDSIKNRKSTSKGIVRHTSHPDLKDGDIILFPDICAFVNEIEGTEYYVMEHIDPIIKII